LFNHRAARNHDVVALLIELDDFEFERLVFQIRRIADRAHVDQGTRQKRADIVDFDGKSALDPAGDDADHDFLFFECRFQTGPRARALRLLA
jgi:hypothetical protein